MPFGVENPVDVGKFLFEGILDGFLGENDLHHFFGGHYVGLVFLEVFQVDVFGVFLNSDHAELALDVVEFLADVLEILGPLEFQVNLLGSLVEDEKHYEKDRLFQ